jgi:hypothetical protein
VVSVNDALISPREKMKLAVQEDRLTVANLREMELALNACLIS